MNGIISDTNGDLMVRNGTLVIGDVTYQNQATILKAHKGEIKEHPHIGVGIDDIANDHEFDRWKRLITEELEKDGQVISKLKITSTGIELEAKYK